MTIGSVEYMLCRECEVVAAVAAERANTDAALAQVTAANARVKAAEAKVIAAEKLSASDAAAAADARKYLEI